MENPERDLARQIIENTNTNLFLTGRAGTGKTTFLRQIREEVHKRMVVLAPTGIFNLSGFHFLTGDPWPETGTFDVTFKVRHTDRWRTGRLTRTLDGTFHIDGDAPIQGIAPGQFGVIYTPDGRVCVGSGEISV